MNASDDRRDLDGLGEFFAASRADAPEVPDRLLRSVLADAEALQPAPRGLTVSAPAPRVRTGWLADVWQGFGGWRGAVALGLFLSVGIATGYRAPDALDGVTTAIAGDNEAETMLVFSLDGLMSEG
jgi:hypothetical protein